MQKKIKKGLAGFLTLLSCAAAFSGCSSRTVTPLNSGLQEQFFSGERIKRNNPDELIKKSWKAYEEMKDFTGLVSIWDSKTGAANDVDYGESNIFFKNPRKEKVEITKSSDSKKVGTLVVYTGGHKVEVLLAKPIPLVGRRFSLDANDKRLATSRGLPFPELDFQAMLRRVSKDGVTKNYLGEGVVNGRKTFTIETFGSFKGIDNEVIKEVLNIDQETFLPIQTEAFLKDNKSVLKISINNLKLNVGLKDDTFVLPSFERLAQRK